MTKPKYNFFKKAFTVTGSLLGVAGIYFVAVKLMEYGGNIDLQAFTLLEYLTISSMVLVYGASGVLLALGWFSIIVHLGEHITKRWAIWAYGISQLAKYVPGNIFHIAGRQAVGAGAGLSHKLLLKSSVGELTMISSASFLFIIPALQRWHLAPYQITISIFALLFLATCFGIFKIGGKFLGQSFLCYSIFHILSGSIFAIIFCMISPVKNSLDTIVIVIGGYNIAWLCGLVTPGAPAGIGVRELVLLFFIGQQADKSSLLLAVVLGRAVTIFGDMLFYIVTIIYMHNKRRTVWVC